MAGQWYEFEFPGDKHWWWWDGESWYEYEYEGEGEYDVSDPYDIEYEIPGKGETTMEATPLTVARHTTMRRIKDKDEQERTLRARRAKARGLGYHGPLTRDELARNAE